MPHGDFSDFAGFALIAGGLQQVFAPDFTEKGLGIFLQNFDAVSAEMAVLNRVMGGFMFVVGCMFLTVRWNPHNSILSGVASLLCGANIAHTTYFTLDNEVFVPRLFYGYAWIMTLAGLHVLFRHNPAIKAAADEDKKK
eukprot:CAMPEP_0114432860 /NCGR_PEP_ID=MMETSP0103-20121206/11383_1 /TAXON_ID=37642 ORGANISM="Paraphysomonas imperforata, Strain PA2" /NCGR_SAMPLE_ID=MMETSP0103 /ASSEMBLY_ACC=CAM_ASM_000201 /LENGTH=138 /DNA_ID=CAMNT_0001602569 /DNA_START=38 /DNA_END=454 /DNA_ORIENTATION=+